ncbi:hypothetical protein ACQPYE_29095 [Actinosynnema sp. CA-299493]
MSALRASRRNYPGIVGRRFTADDAYAIAREPVGMGFVAGRDGRAVTRTPRPGNKSREEFPIPVAHRDTGRGTWFVGESDAERVADLIDKCPERREEEPHVGAAPTGATGTAAPFTGDVRTAPAAADSAALVFETWRRRIAEQVIHQEGVSL